MELSELKLEKGHVHIVGENELDQYDICEFMEFDLEENEEFEDYLEEAWGGVVIGGDLTINGDITSGNLPQGLEGFTGYPISAEGYVPIYFIVVLGNLTVNGTLEVEHERDLYVVGDVNVHSYSSASGNFICTGALEARDIIATNPTDEGGIFSPESAVAPAWISTGLGDYYMLEDLEFAQERIAADGEDSERAAKALSEALGEEFDEDDLGSAVDDCIAGGKIAAFLKAYKALG